MNALERLQVLRAARSHAVAAENALIHLMRPTTSLEGRAMRDIGKAIFELTQVIEATEKASKRNV